MSDLLPAQRPEADPTDLPVMDQPYVPAPSSLPTAQLQSLPLSAPWSWLTRGWLDLRRAPGVALFYGLAFWLMGQVLLWVFARQPEYTLSMVSGCLLVGPFMAMGLYEVSRRHEVGLGADLGASLTCWDGHIKSLSLLLLVLLVLELLWGRASLVVFAVFFNTGMPSTTGVMAAIFNPENLDFVAIYLAVGGVFATLVFATSVVSIPMILDRDTDAISAGITSLRVFFGEMAVMLGWGAVISLMVVLAFMLPWGLGIVVVGPWLGHASWHAYRGAVHWPSTAEPGSGPATSSVQTLNRP